MCGGAGELELSDERLLCCLLVSWAFLLLPLSLPPPCPGSSSPLGRLCLPTETNCSMGSRNLILGVDSSVPSKTW